MLVHLLTIEGVGAAEIARARFNNKVHIDQSKIHPGASRETPSNNVNVHFKYFSYHYTDKQYITFCIQLSMSDKFNKFNFIITLLGFSFNAHCCTIYIKNNLDAVAISHGNISEDLCSNTFTFFVNLKEQHLVSFPPFMVSFFPLAFIKMLTLKHWQQGN